MSLSNSRLKLFLGSLIFLIGFAGILPYLSADESLDIEPRQIDVAPVVLPNGNLERREWYPCAHSREFFRGYGGLREGVSGCHTLPVKTRLGRLVVPAGTVFTVEVLRDSKGTLGVFTTLPTTVGNQTVAKGTQIPFK